MRSHRIVNSIAFLPAVITLLFLAGSVATVLFDFSATGRRIKSQLHWLSLKDAATARSLISAIVSGILSLAVFSFSLVMIILNQTASQMSNRIVDNLIGNKFQQIVLGVYSGTIVFALFLLSTIRDVESGVLVPALSTYLLIVFTIADLFLFIYFLHYVTQSVKYVTIISRVYAQTEKAVRQICTQPVEQLPERPPGVPLPALRHGKLQGFGQKELLQLCRENNLLVAFLFPIGHYLIQGTPYAAVSGAKQLEEDLVQRLQQAVSIDDDVTVEQSYSTGFRQLAEVALRALSPGVNDPGTAVASLQALGSLFACRMRRHPQNLFTDEKGQPRIITSEPSFDKLFNRTMLPIWDCGENDRMMQKAFADVLAQLAAQGNYSSITRLLNTVREAMANKKISGHE